MKRLLFYALVLSIVFAGCASSGGGRGGTVRVDDHTVWRYYIQELDDDLDDESKAIVEIVNQLDRSLSIEFVGSRSYSASVSDHSAGRVVIDPGSYKLRPSAPSLGFIPGQAGGHFDGGVLYRLTWERDHEALRAKDDHWEQEKDH